MDGRDDDLSVAPSFLSFCRRRMDQKAIFILNRLCRTLLIIMFKGVRKLECRRIASITNWTGCDRAEVLLSTSYDVHTNLALEDWLYQKVDWSARSPLLLLWRNSPCVVIGRHQNPWLECRLSAMAEHGVLVARRNSGGGTVFHDMGNLNCTFFTSRPDYDRLANLRLICRALKSLNPGLNVLVSPRQDILLDDKYKISGTASKLGRGGAYHHCTLLFNVSTRLLSQVLRSEDIVSHVLARIRADRVTFRLIPFGSSFFSFRKSGVDSRSTRSIKSLVKNLSGVCCEDLVKAICTQYLMARGIAEYSPNDVDPNERQFPGLNEVVGQHESWDWIFGRCPAFEVEKEFGVPFELASSVDTDRIVLKMSVKRGTIDDVRVEPSCWLDDSSRSILKNLVGKQFPTSSQLPTMEPMTNLEASFLHQATKNIFADFL